MKKIIITLAAAFLVVLNLSLSAQNISGKKSLEGSWQGKIAVSALEMRIVFNISVGERDSLIATLDSPDQGVKGIKLGAVTLTGNILTIKAEALMAEYTGTVKSETAIEGTWKQNGQSIQLNLSKLAGEYKVNRPQEPAPPYPYITEDVTFTNAAAGIKLAGTLTRPNGNGPFPAIILVTGSGGQNRNEELMGHKPFLVIADWLTRKGYAVLRYDDRGIAASEGNNANATTADLSTDALAAFKYLQTNRLIDSKSIGLAGHSEGGLIAAVCASQNREIAFVISLAGPGLTGEEIINEQNVIISRLSGLPQNEIDLSLKINRKIYSIIKKEKNDQIAEDKVLAYYKKELVKKGTSQADIDKALAQLKTTSGAVIYPWLRYYLTTDPSENWSKVTCPVLALNGEKDTQVAWESNLSAIRSALEKGGNKNVTTTHFQGLNHLFQTCTTGLPKEYGEIEETVAPVVLENITTWLMKLFPLKKMDIVIGG